MRMLRVASSPNARPSRITRKDRIFVIDLTDGTRCVISPERVKGCRALYAFSLDLLQRMPWMAVSDGVVIVAGTLVFEVQTHMQAPELSTTTLLCMYRGICS